MKNFILLTICIISYSRLCAQEYEDEIMPEKAKKWEYYITTGFGLYLPVKSSRFIAETGATHASNFHVSYKSRYFAHVYFDMSYVRYKKNDIELNNSIVTFDYKLNTISTGFDIGYTYPMKRFSPYIYTGTGLSFMDIPGLSAGVDDDEMVITAKNRTFFQYRLAAGLDYKISDVYILYSEAQYSAIPFGTVIDSQRLNGLSVLVGIKMPL